MSIEHENLQMSIKELDELKKSYYEVSDSEQMRSTVRLSKDRIDERDRQFYSVEASKEENLKIDSFLSHSRELNLSERQQRELQVRKTRNINFELMNEEKWSGDSDYMKDVKGYVKRYENALRAKIDLSSKENTALDFYAIKGMAIDAIEKCNNYLSRGKSIFFWRRGRYDAVERTRARLNSELSDLTGLYDRLEKEIKKDGKVADNIKMDGIIVEGDTFITLLETYRTRQEVRAIERRSESQEKKEAKEKVENKDKKKNKEKVENKDKKEKRNLKEIDLNLPENAELKKKYERHKKQKDALRVHKMVKTAHEYQVVIDSKNEVIDRQERRELVKEGQEPKGAYRDDMRAASNMAILHGYSEKQMIEFYKKIRKPYKPEMDKATKTSMAKTMETVFDTIKDFDLSKMNFKTLKELFSGKYLRNMAMTALAMGTEYHIKQYISMLKDKDMAPNLKYDETGITELKSKVNTLMAANSYFGSVANILDKLGMEGLKYLDLSNEELQQKIMETNNPIYATIMSVKNSITENEGNGKKIYGPEIDIKNLYNEERRKLGLKAV